MYRQSKYLVACLLDALELEDEKFCEVLLTMNNVSPNIIVKEKGIAPMHYVCGMENIKLSEKMTGLMLKCGGDPNIKSSDNMTPLHVAALSGRQNIVKMLLEHGGDINVIDDDRMTPILYAVHECHIDVIKIIQQFVFEKKIDQKREKILISANKINSPSRNKRNHLELVQNLEEKKFTPNRINYNFDITSPYYINITHRRKPNLSNTDTHENDTQPQSVEILIPDKDKENLFKLTEENLLEHSRKMTTDKSQLSLIQAWRDKVLQSRARKSILTVFNDIDSLLQGISEDENINFTNSTLNEMNKNPFDECFLGIANKSTTNTSFLTARNDFDNCQNINESNFIRSPNKTDFVVQVAESYVHTDDENGVIFYEKKLLGNEQKNHKLNNLNKSRTSGSTNYTVPDYNTDILRAELTNIGEPPGPITKGTKRLYAKRLIKLKRNPEILANLQNELTEDSQNYSVELGRTVRSKEYFHRIPEYIELEKEMTLKFQNSAKKLREGNQKTSFIYMLMDPRILNNLVAQSAFMETHDIWKRYVKSIFYVGKGKSSRPYHHLYEAMKMFAGKKKVCSDKRNKKDFDLPAPRSITQRKTKSMNIKKLEYILDIWESKKGVVCLHVFHNITPAEAYTREAAIIDALGLQHLTNMKRGDNYGTAQSWTMRNRKCLGVALLYKAMQVFLAEGESQLLPSDII